MIRAAAAAFACGVALLAATAVPAQAAAGEFTYKLADGTIHTVFASSSDVCIAVGAVGNPVVFATNLTNVTANLYPPGSCFSGIRLVLPHTASRGICAEDGYTGLRFGDFVN
jgi:hypothetical protein